MPSADVRLALQENVSMAAFSTLGVGGPARWFVRATDAAQVAAACRWGEDHRVPLFTLGGGSNIVVADSGFPGLVVQVALRGLTFADEGGDTVVMAGAGEPWDPVVQSTVDRGLAGLECLSGIPGSVGGTPIQNVGAYGQEVADTIERLTVYDRRTGAMQNMTAGECRFSYRMSRFKAEDVERFVVCDVSFRLRRGAPAPAYPDVLNQLERSAVTSPTVSDVRQAVLSVRRRKGMVIDRADPDTRSVGSFFMNPVVIAADLGRLTSTAGSEPPAFTMADGRIKIPAAWLIERAGFRRGEPGGPAGISGKHTLALVNRGGAAARDVLELAVRIKRQVADRFGVWLRPEPVFVGFDADPDVEFLRTTER